MLALPTDRGHSGSTDENAVAGRLKLVAASLPQTDVLDRGRQRFGLVLLAVGRDLCGIALKAVVVQNVAIGGRIVITAHPKADKIPLLWTVSEPTATSDLIHIHADLSYTWLRSGRQQSRCYEKNIPPHGFSPGGKNLTAGQSHSARRSSRLIAGGTGTTILTLRYFSRVQAHPQLCCGSDN